MRRGELLALHSRDLDLARNAIAIRRSADPIQRKGRGARVQEADTKNKEARVVSHRYQSHSLASIAVGVDVSDIARRGLPFTNRMQGIAIRTRDSIPQGLRRAARVVIFGANLAPAWSSGIPVHQFATILVHLAARPAEVRGWGAIAEALPELLEVSAPADIDAELAGRPRSVRVRLAYLVQGIAPDLADQLVSPEEGGRSAPKVWFGPRASLKRHSSRFSVADTLLPFDPASLRRAS
jgi:hypothetical protein